MTQSGDLILQIFAVNSLPPTFVDLTNDSRKLEVIYLKT